MDSQSTALVDYVLLESMLRGLSPKGRFVRKRDGRLDGMAILRLATSFCPVSTCEQLELAHYGTDDCGYIPVRAAIDLCEDCSLPWLASYLTMEIKTNQSPTTVLTVDECNYDFAQYEKEFIAVRKSNGQLNLTQLFRAAALSRFRLWVQIRKDDVSHLIDTTGGHARIQGSYTDFETAMQILSPLISIELFQKRLRQKCMKYHQRSRRADLPTIRIQEKVQSAIISSYVHAVHIEPLDVNRQRPEQNGTRPVEAEMRRPSDRPVTNAGHTMVTSPDIGCAPSSRISSLTFQPATAEQDSPVHGAEPTGSCHDKSPLGDNESISIKDGIQILSQDQDSTVTQTCVETIREVQQKEGNMDIYLRGLSQTSQLNEIIPNYGLDESLWVGINTDVSENDIHDDDILQFMPSTP